jgi:hypothetical protein
VVAAVLLLLTPVFELMPLNALGAIVVAGVVGLIEYKEALFLYQVGCARFCHQRCGCRVCLSDVEHEEALLMRPVAVGAGLV